MSLASTLVCTLAFNLTFFVQELFLVLPKALVPGLHPVLFHNNHAWTGHNPIANLLQGTGALADVGCGLVFAALLRTVKGVSSTTTILMLFWMAFFGFFLGLPQVVLGTFIPANDVGTAMGTLGLTAIEKNLAALMAVAIMAVCGYWLSGQFIRSLATTAESATGGARALFIARATLLPAVASVLLTIPFREPRNVIEVIVVPCVAVCSGMLWVQASAGWTAPVVRSRRESPSLSLPLLALVVLLAFFQVILRPGIRFF